MKAFNTRKFQPFMEILEVNKQLVGLENEIGKHELAVKQIQNLVKELAKNKRKSIQQIVAGNMIMDLAGSDAIKSLQEKREQIEIGLKAMNEQYMQRQDTMDGLVIQIYRIIKAIAPHDILKEIDEEFNNDA